MNKLYFGDNFEILCEMDAERVDLICTDPPFNSGRNYNAFFKDSKAQNKAFTDKTMKGARSMAKVKVFLSFEFDKDGELYRNFLQQAARGDSCHDFEDCSMDEAYQPHNDKWKIKARKQIALSDIVIVLLGDDTDNAPGVEVEMTLKNQLYKPGFQIRPTTRTSGSVKGGGDVIPWNWKKIDAKITECLET